MPGDIFSRKLKFVANEGWKATCKTCMYSTGFVEDLDTVNLKYDTHYCSTVPKLRRIKQEES